MNLVRIVVSVALIMAAFHYWSIWQAMMASLLVLWVGYRLERTGL